ncbi:hypothetical protein J6590_022556 [Homalodisca vitripennis]|nr:hypothetical protein J6590_022556 [Homalodisca vitripennis]
MQIEDIHCGGCRKSFVQDSSKYASRGVYVLVIVSQFRRESGCERSSPCKNRKTSRKCRFLSRTCGHVDVYPHILRYERGARDGGRMMRFERSEVEQSGPDLLKRKPVELKQRIQWITSANLANFNISMEALICGTRLRASSLVYAAVTDHKLQRPPQARPLLLCLFSTRLIISTWGDVGLRLGQGTLLGRIKGLKLTGRLAVDRTATELIILLPRNPLEITSIRACARKLLATIVIYGAECGSTYNRSRRRNRKRFGTRSLIYLGRSYCKTGETQSTTLWESINCDFVVHLSLKLPVSAAFAGRVTGLGCDYYFTFVSVICHANPSLGRPCEVTHARADDRRDTDIVPAEPLGTGPEMEGQTIRNTRYKKELEGKRIEIIEDKLAHSRGIIKLSNKNRSRGRVERHRNRLLEICLLIIKLPASAAVSRPADVSTLTCGTRRQAVGQAAQHLSSSDTADKKVPQVYIRITGSSWRVPRVLAHSPPYKGLPNEITSRYGG